MAVVTGGAGGLGAAVAVALAGAGARVAVADLDHEGAGAIVSELGPGHIALPIDVRSTASVSAAADAVSAQLGLPPGIVETPMVRGLAADGSLDLDDLSARVPLGRIATPEDIAGVTLMLVSGAGEYIVGQTLIVDGGLSSSGPRDTSRD